MGYTGHYKASQWNEQSRTYQPNNDMVLTLLLSKTPQILILSLGHLHLRRRDIRQRPPHRKPTRLLVGQVHFLGC